MPLMDHPRHAVRARGELVLLGPVQNTSLFFPLVSSPFHLQGLMMHIRDDAYN
jgi:hypothetical protein